MSVKTSKPKPKPKGYHRSDFRLSIMPFLLAGGARMKTCEDCVEPEEELPGNSAWLNDFTTVQRGGICTLFFIKCTVPAFDETSQSAWQTLIDEGKIFVMRDCSLEVGMVTESQTAARGCAAEEKVTGRTMTLNVSDIVDNADYAHAQFWQYTQKYPKAFRVAFATYDGKLYPSNKATINANLNIDINIEGYENQVSTIVWKKAYNDVALTLSGWAPDDLILPNCSAYLNVVSFSGGNLNLQTVSTFSAGATSATYVWTLNGAPNPTTTFDISLVGVVPTDEIVVTVTDNLGCVISATYIVT